MTASKLSFSLSSQLIVIHRRQKRVIHWLCRRPPKEWHSNIGRKLIIPHTTLHLLRARLQELPGLQPHPHLQQARLPPPQLLHQPLAPALRTQLPQYRQRALEQIQVRVQTPADAFQEQDADDDVDEIAFHADVVGADHGEHFVQHVPDFDVAEREGGGFDAEDEVLHFQGEDFFVDDGVGLPASFHHQMAGAVAVEFGDGFEEVEEVCAVGLVEGGYEARVDED